MIYAYVENRMVKFLEERLKALPYEDSLNPLIEAKLYPGGMIPFFKPVDPKYTGSITAGWLLMDDGKTFRMPRPGEVDPKTGQLYMPATLDAARVYEIIQNEPENEQYKINRDSLLLDIDFRLTMIELMN